MSEALDILTKNTFKELEKNTINHGDFFDLIHGVKEASVDVVICDGPYGVTNNDWDKPLEGIQNFNHNLIKIFSEKLKEGGALYLFGKHSCLDFIDYRPYLNLRKRIIWYQPARLSQGRKSYTNNYDVICYFIKGKEPKTFNLKDIRVPQLVELAHRKRCENVPSVTNGKWGKTKFNNKGKNPGDVWGDIKQLTYNSKELINKEVLNTIQKPESLIKRLILASSNEGDLILDPFSGVGTCPSVCVQTSRDFLAFEQNKAYVDYSNQRISQEKTRLRGELFSDAGYLQGNNKSSYRGTEARQKHRDPKHTTARSNQRDDNR